MKPQGFNQSRPSQSSGAQATIAATTSKPQNRQSSVGSSGGVTHHQHGVQQSQQHHAVLTPVQQKFSSNLLNTGSGAAINNYLSSGGRDVQGSDSIKGGINAASQSPADLLFMNQFNRTNLKKSEVKQLQKYCEQNGLDFNSIYSQQNHQQQQQLSKSLSKERSGITIGKSGASQQSQMIVQPQTSQAQHQQYFIQQHQPVHPLKSSTGSKSHSHRPNQKSYQTSQPQYSHQQQQSQQQTHHHHHHYSNQIVGQHQVLHNSSSVSAMLVDRSPLSSTTNAKISQKTGGHALVNFAASQGAGGAPTTAPSVGAQSTSQQPGGYMLTKNLSSGHVAKGSQQAAPQPWKQTVSIHHPMMPSQMSYNNQEVVVHGNNGPDNNAPAHPQQHQAQQQQQNATSQQNFSASNGYFSQKTSPMGRLSVSGAPGVSPDHHISKGPVAPKTNKVIRQPHVTGPVTSKAKGGHLHGNASQKDLNIAYQNQKRQSLIQQQNQHQGSVSGGAGASGGVHHTNSNSSLDKSNSKYHHHQIDSGVGVISGGQSSGGQSSLNPRKEGGAGFHRGIQVEMKTAIQSRRKHGSIDTYKQTTNTSNHHPGGQIRQGQGEIAQQQRVSNVKNNSIFSKGVTATSNNQLPKVIRNQNSKTGGGGASSRPSERVMQQAVSSTPSLNNSPSKVPARHTASSPSEEMRYQQSSNYTNAVRQSALSRGSIKQSSQQALSGSNQMNLSLSQNSSRGLGAPGGHKSHKDASVEQMQERRIAYEASQGKMQPQQQLSASVSNLRQSTTTVKSGSNEMLLAYSQQQQQQQKAFAAAQSSTSQLQPDDHLLNQQVPNIVLQQQVHHHKQGSTSSHHGNTQRHSRIRTKSNHGSIERISNDHQALKPASSSKRGAITAAQNSPRQALSQLKSKQPRIPEANQEVEKYYGSRVGGVNQSSQQPGSTKADVTGSQSNASQYLAKAMKAQSSSLMTKTPPNQDFHTVQQNPGAAQLTHHLMRHQDEGALNSDQQNQLAYLQQQHSSSISNNPRFAGGVNDELQTNSIEQYSRKLLQNTPSPILDGGTGSGGGAAHPQTNAANAEAAAATSSGNQHLQNQARQLLKEQQVALFEKLGYVPQQPQQQQEMQGGHSKVKSSQQQVVDQQHQQQQQQYHQKIGYAPLSQPQHHQAQHQNQPHHQQKKSTLLQMQHQKQQQNQHSLNLSHSNVNTSGFSASGHHHQHHHNHSNTTSLKQASTKTSAQTVSTVKGIAHPKFLQYAASKQSTANSGAGNNNNPAINASSLKLKKSGALVHQQQQHQHQAQQQQQQQHQQALQQQHHQNTSSQSNLIMHQNASKRSSSQEIVIQHKQSQQPQQTVKIHPVGQMTDIGGINSQEQLQNHQHQQNLLHQQQQQQQYNNNNRKSTNPNEGAAGGGNPAIGNPTAPAKRLKPSYNKGEKRSSSQPTSMNADMGSQQAKYLPKHYNLDEKKQQQRVQYYQNRRLSDDPVTMQQSSRQQIAVRTSQKSIQLQHQSRSSVGNERDQQQRVAQVKQINQSVVGNNKTGANDVAAQNRMVMLNGSNIDYQSVRVSIAGNENSKLVQKAAAQPGKKAAVQEDPQHAIAKRLRKQSSVPHLHPQPPPQTTHQNNAAAAHHHQHNRSELSKLSKQSSANMRKSQSNGPGRPQYSVNQPNIVARPETMVTDIDARRLITEDDEQEIRQVASDINEQAFYGKIIRTKKAIKNESEFNKLSPRSQEIGYVMQKVERAFTLTQQPPITDITFYRIGKMLGRGAFGKVNLAMHKLVRKLVALKSLNKEALTDEVQKAKLMKEVNLLLKLRHNHVVKIYETIETQKHIIIVMELCAGGDLLNYVRKRRRLKEPFAQKIFRQIIDGLSYIHSKNIAHRDIKLDNILLDGKGNVKIADFGVSRQIQPDQIMREQCGTPAYIAPEILRNRGYSLNVDLWSAGVVLFAMLYGTVPFKAQTMDELHQLILKGKYLLKEDISMEARDLLRGLLEINPKRRISIRKIYKHPWLRSMDPSVQLFNDEERKMIKKEYTYNDGSRYNRNENEEPVDCFTQHNLESQYSTLKNQESKSIILAPFNSTMSEQSPQRQEDTRNKLMELMEVKQQVLRFSKKCREIDRQYEFNNNGQLDNGVYHKVVANNSFEQQDKFEETQGIEIEQSLQDSLRNQNRKAGKSASNARNNNQISASEQSSFLSMAEDYNIQNNQPRPLDPPKVQKLVSFGYPESYVVNQMREMHANYCTAGYYLLEMDQNYC